MEIKEKRNEAADVYKGIGIVVMLMGHIGFGEMFSYIIHAFHMPMFFFISGFLFKESGNFVFDKWMQKKAASLLVPYFIYGLLNYFIWVMMIVMKGYQWGLKDFLNPLVHLLTINTTKLPIAGALWFLTALFWTNLFFVLIHYFIKKKVIAVFVAVVTVVAGFLCVRVMPVRLPWALDAGMVGLGLFYAGYLYRKCTIEKEGMKHPVFRWGMTGIGAVLCMAVILINDEVNMRLGEYGKAGLFFLGAVGSSVLIYKLSQWLVKAFMGKAIFGKVITVLQMVGKHSLTYVGLSQVINAALATWVERFIVDEWLLQKLMLKGLILILTIGMLEFAEKYLKVSQWGRCAFVSGRR